MFRDGSTSLEMFWYVEEVGSKRESASLRKRERSLTDSIGANMHRRTGYVFTFEAGLVASKST